MACAASCSALSAPTALPRNTARVAHGVRRSGSNLQQRHAPQRCSVARPQAGSSKGNDAPQQQSATAPDIRSLEFPPAGTAAEASATAATASSSSGSSPLRSSGLHRAPGTGVQNATQRCDLPSPAVAVRNLVEQAQFAHLCTTMSSMHHRRAGYPFGTLVDLAVDGAGHPIFSLSPLAIQTRNILEDPRCSLVVQLPGYSGLSNARATIFGDVYRLPESMYEAAQDIFHAKQAGYGKRGAGAMKKQERMISGGALYFRMNRIVDIYFVGGFGTVQWVEASEYATAQPDAIVVNQTSETLRALNKSHAKTLRELLSRPGQSADDAAFVSIDRLGTDVRVRSEGEYTVIRISFDRPADSLEDAMGAMQRLARDPANLPTLAAASERP